MTDRTAADVAIVGAGPSGIAAALSLRRHGVERVIILEREAAAGGVPRHCGHPPFGMREFGRVLSGPAYARRLVAAALAAGVEIRTGTSVVALHPGGRLDTVSAGGVAGIDAKRVILATGVRETPRAARLVSGERPVGVMTTATLQQSIYIEGLRPFCRPVIVGTELVGLSAVLTCRKAGIRPAAVVESGHRPVARRPMALFPRLLGVPVHYGAVIADIRGKGRVEAITLQLADGSVQEIACDGVVFSGCFTPESALVRPSHIGLDAGSGGPCIDQFGRCDDPAYFAAGNLLRPVETAGWSFREGARIGRMVAQDLAGALPAGGAGADLGRGANIRLVVPQRLTQSALPGFSDRLQIRVRAEMAGVLTARRGAEVLWQRRGHFLPERRIAVPMAPLLRAAAGTQPIMIEVTGQEQAHAHRGD